MAKKKKQKKTNVAKKQQAKQQKRKIQKKREGSAPPQKKMSMSKMKKTLRNIPNLVFEPEIARCGFPRADVEKVMQEHSTTPEQINAICTEEYQAKLLAQLKALEVRVLEERDSNIELMVKALVYFMESEQSLPNFNQLVVGLYLKAHQEITGEGEAVTLDNVIQLLDDYEEKWKDVLEEGNEQMKQALEREQGDADAVDGEIIADYEEEEDEELEASPYDEILSDFEANQLEKTNDSSLVENMMDDLEVFCNEYLEGEKVSNLNQLTGAPVQKFLGEWFLENMNPMKEDLSKVITTLQVFTEYGKENSLIKGKTYEEISAILDKKDEFLDKLSA